MSTRRGGRGSEATKLDIELSTLEKSRQTYARLIQHYADGEISENQARCFTYMLASFLAYWREEKSQEIEQRLSELEQAMNVQ